MDFKEEKLPSTPRRERKNHGTQGHKIELTLCFTVKLCDSSTSGHFKAGPFDFHCQYPSTCFEERNEILTDSHGSHGLKGPV